MCRYAINQQNKLVISLPQPAINQALLSEKATQSGHLVMSTPVTPDLLPVVLWQQQRVSLDHCRISGVVFREHQSLASHRCSEWYVCVCSVSVPVASVSLTIASQLVFDYTNKPAPITANVWPHLLLQQVYLLIYDHTSFYSRYIWPHLLFSWYTWPYLLFRQTTTPNWQLPCCPCE